MCAWSPLQRLLQALYMFAPARPIAVRNIPLTPRVREILIARKRVRCVTKFVFPGPGNTGHITTVQHAHEGAPRNARLHPFPFYCFRLTLGTCCAEAGMDKFSLSRLMGHSSPRVAERYYVYVSDQHVNAGFEKLLTYQALRLISV